MSFRALFSNSHPILAVIHLDALPGAHRYGGDMEPIFAKALQEAHIYQEAGVDGVIIENFKDAPFYPQRVPVETVAAMSAVAREVVKSTYLPVGINVLRNDAVAGMAIAAAVGAEFIRVNVHLGAVVADQGIIQGNAHESLRLRQQLGASALIFADIGVKHAAPLVQRELAVEAQELAERGCVDALIVSGRYTGDATSLEDVQAVRQATEMPLLIGSGTTENNLAELRAHVDGFIIGSAFKVGGQVLNPVSADRVQTLVNLNREI